MSRLVNYGGQVQGGSYGGPLFTRPSSPAPAAGLYRNHPMQGFASAGEFFAAVHTACKPSGERDPRLITASPADIQAAPANFHNESSGTEGYLVPRKIREEIFEIIFDQDNFAGMVDREPTAGNVVELLADEWTPWGGSGVQCNWRSEGSQLSASRAEVSPRRVRLNELYAFVTATDEIVEDAPRLGTILTRQAARAILWQLNEAIFRGNGVGKPLGFLSAPSLVTVEQEAGQTADTITAPNVLKMYSRLAPGSSNRAVWLVHPSAIPQLYTMTIGSQPVFLPSNTSGLQEMSEFGLLCGRPIVPSDHCATLGDVGDIILADPMGYYLPVKQTGLQFASSMHVFFDYGIHAFRWTIRVGGQPHLSAPISPANGNATKSHFIVLEERAGS